MMAFLIDITDPRFDLAENADVLAFIRRANPFAHTDVGSLLFALARAIPGAGAYCPAPASCAYVVLHTGADRIVAIAYGQRGLAFRLPAALHAAALADGGALAPEIGPDWVRFDPWDLRRTNAQRDPWLRRWAEQAVEHAHTEPRDPP